MSNKKKKVFVGMSGGVDSSVAAALLKYGDFSAQGGPALGWDVVGIHLKCYNIDGCAEQDAEDARRVAEILNIPFYVFDMEKEYKEKVVEYMVEGYRKGITPNPDVMCNKEIKFGLFLNKALEMGADYVATGHYVQLKKTGSKYKLFQAKDKNKDQSYFLWTLTQKQLKHCLFPIGDYLKSEVRKIAKKYKLPNADKKDSQGICFLGKVSLKDFLKDYIKEKKGKVLDVSGKVVGEHKGAHFYTIGQRRLGIMNYESGIRGQNNRKPCYVVEKDIKTNTILVAEENDLALFKKEIKLKNVNFINPIIHNSKFMIPVMVRIRYRQPLVPAILITGRKLSVVSCKLKFDRPVKFVASGQSAVFYTKRGEMMGGGVIL